MYETQSLLCTGGCHLSLCLCSLCMVADCCNLYPRWHDMPLEAYISTSSTCARNQFTPHELSDATLALLAPGCCLAHPGAGICARILRPTWIAAFSPILTLSTFGPLLSLSPWLSPSGSSRTSTQMCGRRRVQPKQRRLPTKLHQHAWRVLLHVSEWLRTQRIRQSHLQRH